MTTRSRFALRWVPAVAMAAGILVLSSIPGTAFPQVEFVLADKIAHMLLFSAFAAAFAIPIHHHWPMSSVVRVVIISTVLAAIYGTTDELHQLLTPNRSSDVWDVVADTVGGFVGSFGYMLVAGWKGRAGTG